MNKSNQWRVVTYDVWGNATDGWEVNDKFRTPHVLELDDETGDFDVLNLLCEVMGGDPNTLEIDNNTSHESVQYVLDTETGEPVCELVRVGV